MKKIRKSIFETNSSSTHSICIAKDVEPIIPSSIDFAFGEFGWECDTLNSDFSKASYLYTALNSLDRDRDIARVIEMLKNNGVEVRVEQPVYEERSYKDASGALVKWNYGTNIGYVDHCGELGNWLDAVCNDEERLLNFLFSPLSFIITGNDNDDEDVNICVSYPHEKYYKGN